MNTDSAYFKRARLITRVLPTVANEKCFALKGGTAICFFHRDLPRLSVDIDLTYLPIEPREESLTHMTAALERVAGALEKLRFKAERARNNKGRIHKLIVSDGQSRIKIEPNEVLRGTVHPVESRDLSPAAEQAFETAVTAQVVSTPDLFGGKLCAALDRQHPRDLFDVLLLLRSEGITDAIRQTFVVYLACGDRPIHEVIRPTCLDIDSIFEREFRGMTATDVALADLLDAREKMVAQINADLTLEERGFLVSIKEGTPRWDLLPLPGIERLPGLLWKLANVKKMDKKKHALQLQRLRDCLGV